MARAKESVKYNYDIFFSLSHPDRNSTDYLYKALEDSGLRIFRDGDPIERSEDIESDVKKAIERSKFCVVLLSKSYASSKWYLDQLVMMIECKRDAILPLFCDPKGRIGEGFARFEDQLKLETDYQRREKLTDKIQGWSDALSFASDLPGFVLQNQADGDESKFIQKIIEAIEEKVKVVQEDFVPMEAETEDGLLNQEPSSLVEDWTAVEINLRDTEELPENPNCPFLVELVLEQSHDLTEIPDSFFESMPVLQVLDLSTTSIKTLPRSIASLTELRQFFLRDCLLLRELPPEIGELKNLEVFDLEGTELMCLPKEIRGLLQLESLKVSLCRCADNYIERKGIKAIIPRATLSKCSHLKELSILVDPDCEWWDAEVEAIINELPRLKKLGKLELYFPTLELLQKFLQLPGNVYQNLSNFRLTVGRHEQHIISSLPHNLQSVFEKLDKCLKYVNGKGNVDGIGKALEHARALFLDRQWTIEKLSAFKIDEMYQLNFCLVVECNEMNAIVDGGDFYQERDNGGKPILGSLRYLSVHYMKNLQSIWKGPIVSHCLSCLEILALHTCPELTTIFNLALLRNLINLKELIVENCPKVKSLVTADPSSLEAGSDFLPALEKILLVDLPELVSFSGGLPIGPKLETIIFSNCPMLKNLSPADMYRKCMHEIKGESEWWKALDSSNETFYLQRALVSLTSYNDSKELVKISGKPLYQPPFGNQKEKTYMAESLVLQTAGQILGKLTTSAFCEIGLIWGVKKQFERLQLTVSAIKAFLPDAAEQKKSRQLEDWLEKLKDVLYDVDNVLDDFMTQDFRREVLIKRGKLKEARNIFSSSISLSLRMSMSHKLKKIRSRLEDIDADRKKFELIEHDPDSTVAYPLSAQTHSFVRPSDAIRRDLDKTRIIELLVSCSGSSASSSITENISVLPIVGPWEVGKTTPAKLVYDDDAITSNFETRLWICLSKDFDLKKVIEKIKNDATGADHAYLDLYQLQAYLRSTLDSKKFLLVLDDVWIKDVIEWAELKALLKCGSYGSKIVVTTRGKIAAKIMGTLEPYELKGLLL